MIPRLCVERIKHLLSLYPAVALTGARRIGKSALTRQFSEIRYDIERSVDITRLDIEWVRRMRGKELIVLDEIQTAPELFLRLQAAIDEHRSRNGRFLLTESFASHLIKSMNGRCAVCDVSTLLAREIPEDRWDELWATGGYPENIGALDPFPVWQEMYLERIAERDLPNWGYPAPPRMTARLFQMLAGVHGQIWNASQIARSLGVSYHTVNTYVQFFQRAGLLRSVPACALPLKKRLVKSPRLYWRDTGLLHTLLGMKKASDLYMQPWVGMSWEGWIIEQLASHLGITGRPLRVSHLQTSDQYRLALLLEYRDKRWGIDISISSVPDERLFEQLAAACALVNADHSLLISRAPEPIEHHGVRSLNLSDTLDLLDIPSATTGR